MKVGSQQKKIHALINLLEDDDNQVSSLAMEQLLMLDSGADELVREFQESPSPILRNRIHQLDNMLTIRRKRRSLLSRAHTGRLTLCEGLVLINQQHNSRLNASHVNTAFDTLCKDAPRITSSMDLAAFFRDQDFSLCSESYLASELYLLDDVLENRVGAPVLLCCLAKCLADRCNWPVSVILHKGRHCLIDKNRNLIETWDSWKVIQLPDGEQLCHCTKWDLWLAVLSQLFLATLQEGQIQAVYRIASILAGFCGGSLTDLPYPLGNAKPGGMKR